ncbi:MAG TPA: hypothetical protein VFU17_09575 [Candidatus Limnocylindrales bacterium]|nr:hypothetical protein [Candidatus Limnocylindrales bacterium]
MTDVDEASARLDAFIARLQRLDLEDLRLIALPVPDPEERAALLETVDRVAAEAGRTALVDDARQRARDAVVTAYNRHAYDPTWAGLNWGRSLGTTRDRLGLVVAAENAAVAAVMDDLLDEDLVATLTEPFEHAAGMAGSTTTPSLSLDRPGPQGWVVRMVFGVMLVVAALVIGAAEAAAGLIAAILAGRRASKRR